MIEHHPVVVERESNGTFSAWVAGLPGVYAAADTAAAAKRALRSALVVHLDALTRQDLEPLGEGRQIRDVTTPRGNSGQDC